jgi:hypothetical protein
MGREVRLLVCGGRTYGDKPYQRRKIYQTLDAYRDRIVISVLIEGECQTGADFHAKKWAERNDIQVLPFKADWDAYGRAAGPRRNQQMLEEGLPDRVLAFPGGPGTRDMVERAETAGVHVERIGWVKSGESQ